MVSYLEIPWLSFSFRLFLNLVRSKYLFKWESVNEYDKQDYLLMWVKLHASHLFVFTLQFLIYSIKSLKIFYGFIQKAKRHPCGISFDNNWQLNQVICLQKVSVRASVRSVRPSDKAVYELNIRIFSCECQGPNSV